MIDVSRIVGLISGTVMCRNCAPAGRRRPPWPPRRARPARPAAPPGTAPCSGRRSSRPGRAIDREHRGAVAAQPVRAVARPTVSSMPLMPPLSCSRKPQTMVQATSDTTTGEKKSVRNDGRAAQPLVEQDRQEQGEREVDHDKPDGEQRGRRTAPLAASDRPAAGGSCRRRRRSKVPASTFHSCRLYQTTRPSGNSTKSTAADQLRGDEQVAGKMVASIRWSEGPRHRFSTAASAYFASRGAIAVHTPFRTVWMSASAFQRGPARPGRSD